MKTEYVKANRKAIIAAMQESDISRRIDKMDIHETYKFILLDDAKDAAKTGYSARSFVECRVYVTSGSGVYGYQFMAAIWVHVDGHGRIET